MAGIYTLTGDGIQLLENTAQPKKRINYHTIQGGVNATFPQIMIKQIEVSGGIKAHDDSRFVKYNRVEGKDPPFTIRVGEVVMTLGDPWVDDGQYNGIGADGICQIFATLNGLTNEQRSRVTFLGLATTPTDFTRETPDRIAIQTTGKSNTNNTGMVDIAVGDRVVVVPDAYVFMKDGDPRPIPLFQPEYDSVRFMPATFPLRHLVSMLRMDISDDIKARMKRDDRPSRTAALNYALDMVTEVINRIPPAMKLVQLFLLTRIVVTFMNSSPGYASHGLYDAYLDTIDMDTARQFVPADALKGAPAWDKKNPAVTGEHKLRLQVLSAWALGGGLDELHDLIVGNWIRNIIGTAEQNAGPGAAFAIRLE